MSKIFKHGPQPPLFLQPLKTAMSQEYSKLQIESIIAELNKKFNIALNVDDLKNSSYSGSSLRDILVQRIGDELSGEWTTEKAFGILRDALVKLGLGSKEVHMNTNLDQLIPSRRRRSRVKEWSAEAGLELDVLKPNGILYGTLVFLFFTCIPLGIGMDWFISGVGMTICLALLFILGKTGKNFKTTTLGQMAESIAWKNYLRHQKEKPNHSPAAVKAAVGSLVKLD